jgi:hypothetical protein
VKASLWIDVVIDGQRVVNGFRPALFLECFQDQDLAEAGPGELFDEAAAQPKLSPGVVPSRFLSGDWSV